MAHFFSKLITFFKKNLRFASSGYVLILMAIFLPVIFVGIKYVVDTTRINSFNLEKQKKDDNRLVSCGKEAAIAVAMLWNPGLTFDQQKIQLMKTADDVYNKFASMDSIVAGAVPGMDSKKFLNTERSSLLMKYIAILYDTIARSSDPKLIRYTPQTGYIYRITIIVPTSLNPYAVLYGIISEIATKSHLSMVAGSDVVSDIAIYSTNRISFTCSQDYITAIDTILTTLSAKLGVTISATKTKTTSSYYYSVRQLPNDQSKINLSLEAGNIKVISDSVDAGKALPATCDVDIILALPVNGAACSVNNADTTTEYSGSPYVSSSTANTTSTIGAPICEIARAYRTFLKDNFFNSQGTNVGIIPYSAKVSIPPNSKATIVMNPLALDEASVKSTMLLCGCDLYGTNGKKNAPLLPSSFVWGGSGVYPIMCRYIPKNATGRSLIYNANAEPSGASAFVKMNLNPCYMGYANILGMLCEKDCTQFQPNPYPILELTADVKGVYELLGGYFPINDAKNTSNFIFVPLEWAKYLYGTWTANPSASGNSQTVKRNSKTDSGRKRAVIIVVNKPDCFEPGELTYLGFDNDKAMMPIQESDKINFNIDYSSTAKKFLDGTAYNGTIAGPKKILTFSTTSDNIGRVGGFYETTDNNIANCTLRFPQKGTIILKFAMPTPGIDTWQKITHNLQTWGHDCYSGFGHGNGYYISMDVSGNIARSTNLTNWTQNIARLPSGWWSNVVFGSGKFLALSDSAGTAYSTDGATWTNGGRIVDFENKTITMSSGTALCYGNGVFLVLGGRSIAYSSDGITWTIKSNVIPISATWKGVTATTGGDFVAISSSGQVVHGGIDTTWEQYTGSSSSLSSIGYSWGGVCYGNGKLMAVSYSATAAYSTDNGMNWTNHSTGLPDIHYGEWYGTFFEDNTFYAHTSNVYLAKCSAMNSSDPSGIRITNLTSSSPYYNKTNTITQETTFMINAEDISDTKENGMFCINFDIKKVRLISAEITNRSEERRPSAAVNKEAYNADMINFIGGSSSSNVLTYTTASGDFNYKNGAGYECAEHSSAVGKFMSTRHGKLHVTVERNDSKTKVIKDIGGMLDLTKWHEGDTTNRLSNICSSGWDVRNMTYDDLNNVYSKFYTLNNYGYVAYSSDGKQWFCLKHANGNINQLSSLASNWRGLTHCRGYLFASNFSGNVAYLYYPLIRVSDNSVVNDWSLISNDYSPYKHRSSYWYGGIASNGSSVFVINGDGYIAYQSLTSVVNQDLIGWTYSQPLSAIYHFGWDSAMTYGNGRFLSICYYTNVASSSGGTAWASTGTTFPTTGYTGLCYGNGRFVAITSSGAVYHSSDNGVTWTKAGTPLASIRSSGWMPVCYGNSMFVAISSNGYSAYCNELLLEDKTIVPQFKFNNVTIGTSPQLIDMEIQANQEIEVNMENIRLLAASITYSDNEQANAILNFNSSSTSTSVDGVSMTFSGSLNDATKYGLRFADKNSSVNCSLNITNNPYSIESLAISVAPLDCAEAGAGTFAFIPEPGGNPITNSAVKTITSNNTYLVDSKDFTITNGSGDNLSYKISFSMKALKLVSAKLILANRTVHRYPDISARNSSRLVQWNKENITAGTNLTVTNKFNNYNVDSGWHSINSTTCNPVVYPHVYHGDGTIILEEHDDSLFSLNLITSTKNLSGYYAPGFVRIFAESARGNYNRFDINTSTDNCASIITTEFTNPVNNVLFAGGYYNNATDNAGALQILAKETAASLKDVNTKIYVIKYRCPARYKSHMLGANTNSYVPYDYSYLESIASGTTSPYIQTVEYEEDLEEALKEIANDIKSSSFAGREVAKNVP
ncbi:MAG: hypothetical protein LBJ16_01875 [Holosporaceae bacterium]|jgi:hypothetical protein|nr:hypothetical protein [Holosporaceae bacterium]